MDALIGHTGFVGSNLRRQHRFGAEFNSSNFDQAAGQHYELAVCAAAPATMWAANRDPKGDRENIERLLDRIRTITVDRMVLISTIAVLNDANVGYTESSARYEQHLAYGLNRRILEQEIEAGFTYSHIIRLPALFGLGLKKNFLFDILNPAPSFLSHEKFEKITAHLRGSDASLLRSAYTLDSSLNIYRFSREEFCSAEKQKPIDAIFEAAGFTSLSLVNSKNVYQYYGLDMLWRDIGICIQNDIPVMHLAPEPIEASAIYASLTGKPLPGGDAPLYREDMRTEYSANWSNNAPYIENRTNTLSRLKDFYLHEGRMA